jgi:SAM-dependent methyltransferase
MNLPDHALPRSAAAERNRDPILAVLRSLLAPSGRALEIASGTGQHAAHFASALPGWTWQPSDRTDAGFAAIRGWAEQTGAANVLPPRRLDVLDADWPSDGAPFASGAFDLVYVANLLHISRVSRCPALIEARKRLAARRGSQPMLAALARGATPPRAFFWLPAGRAAKGPSALWRGLDMAPPCLRPRAAQLAPWRLAIST